MLRCLPSCQETLGLVSITEKGEAASVGLRSLRREEVEPLRVKTVGKLEREMARSGGATGGPGGRMEGVWERGEAE